MATSTNSLSNNVTRQLARVFLVKTRDASNLSKKTRANWRVTLLPKLLVEVAI